MKPKYYSKKFKLNAVKLYINYKGEKSIKRVAEELKVSKTSLGYWILDYRDKGEDSFKDNDNDKYTPDENIDILMAELQSMNLAYNGLKKELCMVMKERDSLKKAAENFLEMLDYTK